MANDVFPPDYSTDLGQVRALIPDVEQLPNPMEDSNNGSKDYLFTDEHLNAFIAIEHGNVKLAAAAACEALGTSEGLISKVIKTEDLQTDGAKLMGQFIARGRLLRQTAAADELSSEAVFEVVPYVLYPAQREPR